MVRDRVNKDQRRPINGEQEEMRVRMRESQISRIPIRSRGVNNQNRNRSSLY